MSTLLMEDATTFATEVDSHHGIYTAQTFAEYFGSELKGKGVDQEKIDSLLAGPEDEYYWDAYSSLLPIAFKGRTYFNGEDGDIFSLSTEEYEQIDWEN